VLNLISNSFGHNRSHLLHSHFYLKYNYLSFPMDIHFLNMYQRLRDFKVPSAILDEIFGNPEELKILEDAWNDLKKEEYVDDEIARAIAKIIFKDLKLEDPVDDLIE
jgi:hypothetical protein